MISEPLIDEALMALLQALSDSHNFEEFKGEALRALTRLLEKHHWDESIQAQAPSVVEDNQMANDIRTRGIGLIEEQLDIVRNLPTSITKESHDEPT